MSFANSANSRAFGVPMVIIIGAATDFNPLYLPFITLCSLSKFSKKNFDIGLAFLSSDSNASLPILRTSIRIFTIR